MSAFVSKFNFWNDVDVIPVIDLGEGADRPVVGRMGEEFLERLRRRRSPCADG